MIDIKYNSINLPELPKTVGKRPSEPRTSGCIDSPR